MNIFSDSFTRFLLTKLEKVSTSGCKPFAAQAEDGSSFFFQSTHLVLYFLVFFSFFVVELLGVVLH